MTSLRLSDAKATYGDEEVVSASVSVSPEFSGSAPTGTVILRDSTTTLCVITLSGGGGACRLAATRLGAGTYHLVASYDGNANVSSSAAEGTLTVSKSSTAIALKVSPAKVTLGDEQVAHFSVAVSPAFGGTPTGTVIVRDSSGTLCVISLSSARGTCSISPSALGVGTYHVVATYEGSSDFDASVSATATLTVVFSLSVG